MKNCDNLADFYFHQGTNFNSYKYLGCNMEIAEGKYIYSFRVWAKNADYWTVYFDIIEAVKTAFDKEGIEIPFNQLDVNIKNK